MPITNSQVHQDETTTGAGTTSTVGTNTAGACVRWGELVGVDAIRKEVNALYINELPPGRRTFLSFLEMQRSVRRCWKKLHGSLNISTEKPQ